MINKAPKTGLGLLYLSTSWCTFCKQTGPAIDDIEREMTDLTVVRIDGDDDIDTCMEVGVKSFPTIVLTRDGEELTRRGSDIDKLNKEGKNVLEDLRDWIKTNS